MTRFIFTLMFLFVFCIHSFTQLIPDKEYSMLFHDVQLHQVYSSSKVFPDCTPVITTEKIDSYYRKEKQITGFVLKDFVETYFLIPSGRKQHCLVDTNIPVEEYINDLWTTLHVSNNTKTNSSLISLPYQYISTGGNNELNYLNGYFALLGLRKEGKAELVECMVKNYAWMIDTFGYIPVANRTYYLSRSQMPFFSLMVELLAEIKGDSVYAEYLNSLEKEYNYWMNGKNLLSDSVNAVNRVVLMPGNLVLNRYWGNEFRPRSETYYRDIQIAGYSPLIDSIDYRNIYALEESGYVFNADTINPDTLKSVVNILSVQLNCLLYNLELTLSKASLIAGNTEASKVYSGYVKKRKKAINKYLWNKEQDYYHNYNFITQEYIQTDMGGTYPLYFSIAPNSYVKSIVSYISDRIELYGQYEEDGVRYKSLRYRWFDYYVCVKGLENYSQNKLGGHIKEDWLQVFSLMYKNTGCLVKSSCNNNSTAMCKKSDLSHYNDEAGISGLYLYFMNEQD